MRTPASPIPGPRPLPSPIVQVLAIALAGAAAIAFAADADGIAVHGVVVAEQQATLSSRLATAVARVRVVAGDAFAAGDALIDLDCDELRALREQAVAREQAEQANRAAVQRLAELNASTPVDVAQAEARLATAASERTLRDLHVGQCTIRAPFAGVVSRVHAQAHSYVQVGSPLIDVLSNAALHVELAVPSAWLGNLHAGDPVRLHVLETGRIATGEIAALVPHIDPVSRTATVRVRLRNDDATLIAGMSGRAEFPACADCRESAR